MINRGERLIEAIDIAFAARKLPVLRIIDSSVDLNYHVEAQRVEAYFRKNHDVVDRQNSVLVAFNYFTVEAAIWAIPLYIKSIIRQFNVADFITVHFCGALAEGAHGTRYSGDDSHRNLGFSMRQIATDQEAAAVCSFCVWLDEVASPDEEIEGWIDAVKKIWC